jgi:hypothetical protein
MRTDFWRSLKPYKNYPVNSQTDILSIKIAKVSFSSKLAIFLAGGRPQRQ